MMEASKDSDYYIHTALLTSLLVVFFASMTDSIQDSQNDRPQPAATVEMTNTLEFTPDTVYIEQGQKVQWINSSQLVHSVTADPEKETIDGSVHLPDGAVPFGSGMMDPKEKFSHTFETTGSYTYFCIPHEAAGMKAVIIVR
ncbi:MAG: plastocyanin/azurin family copper-binding protein [Balneolaceae bacterium]|nr:plastocyanin/azurin family copper-binding protein [Balneolaceae bacterium]